MTRMPAGRWSEADPASHAGQDRQVTCYWSDEAYAQFYASSSAEKRRVNNISSARDDAEGLLDASEQNRFLQAFVEWSGQGRGQGWLRRSDFRPFLAQVDIDLSGPQSRALWADIAGEDAAQMSYNDALQAYLQVQDAPMRLGATTSGPRTACGSFAPPHPYAASTDRVKRQAAASGGSGLMVAEARDFLLAEGMPLELVETFLQRHGAASDDFVPSAALFDLLARWAEGETLEGESVCYEVEAGVVSDAVAKACP